MLTPRYILKLTRFKEQYPMPDDYGFMVDHSGGNDPVGMKARLGGGLPDLLTVLWAAYQTHILKQYTAFKKQGKKLKLASPIEAAAQAPAENFLAFARAYLDKNRPVQQFAVDDNVGVMLRNQVRCCISPNNVRPGQMQDANAVPVTTGDSQDDLGGMQPGSSVGI